MKVFIVALCEAVKKDYPDINFDFYVAQIKICAYGNENKDDDLFKFCVPRLIAAAKYKYDYIIFEKV